MDLLDRCEGVELVRIRRTIVTLAASVIAATAMLSSPASAHPTGPPNDPRNVCPYDDIVISCFEANGDDFWVWDRESDGASAVVDWWTSDGESGSCRNSHGVATWHECSYDLTEGQTVYWEHWTYDADTGAWDFISGPYQTVVV
jgi:hypothetical protein